MIKYVCDHCDKAWYEILDDGQPSNAQLIMQFSVSIWQSNKRYQQSSTEEHLCIKCIKENDKYKGLRSIKEEGDEGRTKHYDSHLDKKGNKIEYVVTKIYTFEYYVDED